MSALGHVIDIPSTAVATRHDAPLPVANDNKSLTGAVLRIISDPSTPPDRLNAALDFVERLEKRDAKRLFENALQAAKAAMPPILKDREVDFINKSGQHTHYKHEDLPGLCRVVDPVLAKHGLSYRWNTSATSAGVVVVTCVIRGFDHEEQNSLPAPPDNSGGKNAIQAVGSAVTYLQRYTLKAALGLAACHDDDGRGGPKDDPPAPEVDRVPTQAISYDTPISAALVDELVGLIAKANANIDKLLKYAKAESLSDIKASQFGDLKAMLLRKAAGAVHG